MMRNKLKVLVMMCALVLGLSASAAAQNRYGRRDGRTVTVYQTNRRVYRPYSRNVIIVPNNRHVLRGARNDGWGNRQINRARTYRLPNGRLVTVLPNGRRIYH